MTFFPVFAMLPFDGAFERMSANVKRNTLFRLCRGETTAYSGKGRFLLTFACFCQHRIIEIWGRFPEGSVPLVYAFLDILQVFAAGRGLLIDKPDATLCRPADF